MRREGVGHGRQRLPVDLDQLGGVLREHPRLRDDDGDAVAAWRALSLARGQCSLILMSSVTGHAQTSGAGHSSARSAPLKAATHPSIATAFETSTPLIFAWAKGLRTT